MHILDRLSKDLAELMEREWVKPNANPDRLYISLLLLLGWRRETGKTSTTQHPDRRVDEEDRLDAADEAEEQEEENDDVECIADQTCRWLFLHAPMGFFQLGLGKLVSLFERRFHGNR